VIVVSARPDARELLEATGGVDAFVTKPFNVNTLAGLVADRIASAVRLANEAGLDPVTGLLGHEYVEARLVDELTVASPDHPCAFALARLLSLEEITDAVGDEGLEYVSREIVRRLRDLLPDDAAFGLTRGGELAILLPDTAAAEAVPVLSKAVDDLCEVVLPGGYAAATPFAVGVAGYPDHAADADGLYMAADAAFTNAVETQRSVAIAL
jgi:GGDEF domain-containing protein